MANRWATRPEMYLCIALVLFSIDGYYVSSQSTIAPSNGHVPIRLVNGNNNQSGRVEVYHNGVWGTVCDDGWGFNDARVVCRQLNFTGAVSSHTYAYFGRGSGPIWMTFVSCSGSESYIDDCRYTGLYSSGTTGVTSCGHYEDAGVTCEQADPDLRDNLIQLTDSNRVQVSTGGVWREICGTSWDRNDGAVVCRQLGFPFVKSVSRSYTHYSSSATVLRSPYCFGNETSIDQCPQFGRTTSYCSYRATVICANSSNDVLNCTFETGVCDFQLDNWRRTYTGYYQSTYEPNEDHTLGTRYGYYMLLGTSSSYNPATLTTPPVTGVQPGENAACLLFWYYKDDDTYYGTGSSELNVCLRTSSGGIFGDCDSPVWQVNSNRGAVWRPAEVIIDISQPFEVVFSGWRYYRTTVTIDDITITRDECSGDFTSTGDEVDVTCDFEWDSICNYTQDSRDDFNWTRHNDATSTLFTGPKTDHTTGEVYGFYMFISYGSFDPYYSDFFPSERESGDKARLISPVVEINDHQTPSCVEFWYHMYGRNVDTLNVYAELEFWQSRSLGEPIWTKTGNQRDDWHRATADISFPGHLQIIFEAILGENTRCEIAIDDVRLYRGQECPVVTTMQPPSTTTPPTSSNASCDFEESLCGYQQDEYSELDWYRLQARNQTRSYYYYNSKPRKDHTTGSTSGYFIVFDPTTIYSSRNLIEDDAARLRSPLLQASERASCLSLYSWGYYSDFFNVYFQPYGTWLPNDPHWSMYGGEKHWVHQLIDIPAQNQPFYLVLEALAGSGNKYIAIDDIVYMNGECPSSGIDCDFESDALPICSYAQADNDDFDWTRQSGSTATGGTGPSVDHTFGNDIGHYMYIETSLPRRPNDYAQLNSPTIYERGRLCLRFYYHANGADTGSLSVYIYAIDRSSDYLFGADLTISGQQPDRWLPAKLNITSTGPFKIYFRGRVGHGPRSDIAIDDIRLLLHGCDGLPTEGMCDFSAGPEKCGYENNATADVEWDWFDPNFDTMFLGQRVISDRFFMYAMANGPAQNEISASPVTAGLLSNAFMLRGADHCLIFDYVMSASSQQILEVYVVPFQMGDGPMTKLGRLVGSSLTTSWNTTNMTLSAATVPETYRIVFFATVVGQNQAVAIDNPTVTMGRCTKADTGGSLGTTTAPPSPFIPPTPATPARPVTPARQVASDSSTVSILAALLGVVIVLLVVMIIGAAIFCARNAKKTQSHMEMMFKRFEDTTGGSIDGRSTIVMPDDVTISDMNGGAVGGIDQGPKSHYESLGPPPKPNQENHYTSIKTGAQQDEALGFDNHGFAKN